MSDHIVIPLFRSLSWFYIMVILREISFYKVSGKHWTTQQQVLIHSSH
jgi:hypothetical protein